MSDNINNEEKEEKPKHQDKVVALDSLSLGISIVAAIIIGFGIYHVTQPYIKRYNQRKEAKELYFANQVCEHYIRYKYKREIKELPPEIIKKEDINKEAHNECYYSLTPSRKEIFLEMKTELEQQGILSYKGGREY